MPATPVFREGETIIDACAKKLQLRLSFLRNPSHSLRYFLCSGK